MIGKRVKEYLEMMVDALSEDDACERTWDFSFAETLILADTLEFALKTMGEKIDAQR